MKRRTTPSYPSINGPLDLDTLVDGYVRGARMLMDPAVKWDERHPDAAAYDALRKAIRKGPAHDAWIAVVELLRRAPDEELGSYAAGPLEDLVSMRGAELVREIESEAARDERFRWALGCIWLSRGGLPDDVLRRVVRASGGAIQPLPPRDEREKKWPLAGEKA